VLGQVGLELAEHRAERGFGCRGQRRGLATVLGRRKGEFRARARRRTCRTSTPPLAPWRRTFETALSANDIAKGWLLLSTLDSQGPYDTSTDQARQQLQWRVFRIVVGADDADLPKDDASRGREILLILSNLVTSYPFQVEMFSSMEEVEAWMSDLFGIVRGPGSPLIVSQQQEVEFGRLVTAFGEKQPVAQAIDYFERTIRALRGGDELAVSVRSLLQRRKDFRGRLPSRRLVVAGLSVAAATALCGVILPMLWSVVPWWIYSALPAIVYALFMVGAMVFVALKYGRAHNERRDPSTKQLSPASPSR
jgi:hypothetical protein